MEKHGISGNEEFIKTKLGRWKDVEINIGIIGNYGVGKSSFINAIRGLRDDDNGAAETGVTETANVATVYHHPTNNKIKFWNLPSIGTPDYPTDTYSDKVGLEKYDTFLILAAGRFTINDLLLAEKVKSMKKSFFFVRTKIDQDVQHERRKARFNEEAMLNDIREDCLKNLERFEAGDEVVFLISNHYPAKWDFARLTQAILDVLPQHQKESLTLSLDLLTSHSKDILKRKVEILRGRIWMVAAASAAAAVIPLPGLSIVVDFRLLTHEVNLYKSQLGLPKEKSNEFLKLTKENREIILKFCFTNAAELAKILTVFAAGSAVEEVARFIPIIGSAIAGGISFGSTYYFLRQCLNELEKTALNLLDETNANVVRDIVNSVD
ncbi:interferon-inducible GTPase 5-like [Paramuricea clavata]|uniref:Interferon-inducible GTPase 5-like n=1 Tax=Paramuricea clavata TaxID=317549 RepID=A0A6S7KUJ1_PARCT|nr:interferon-inducible GTPase 5-like [Paramuricea clavata]